MSKPPASAPPWWYGDRPPPLGARLLSGIYAVLVRMRGALFRRGLLRSIRVPAPVLVVGNLVAGGSGKTPLAIALVERLRAAGWTPGVATRGHGRDDAGTPLWVEAATDPRLGGDEPVLIATRTGAKVRADPIAWPRRERSWRRVASRVCDDGCSITVGARCRDRGDRGRRRYGKAACSCRPLREPVAAAKVAISVS